MTKGVLQFVEGWFRDRWRLVWPFVVALGLTGMSAQRLAPLVHENGIRARDLARLGRQVDLLQELLQSAATGSVEVRAEQARASLFAGQAGVREWLLAVEQAAALAGFSCDPEITAGARHWEEDPKVQLVEVVLRLKATADSNLASTASVRFSDFLNELAKRLEWAEFTGLVLRGTGTGLVSGSIKLRLWVVVPAS